MKKLIFLTAALSFLLGVFQLFLPNFLDNIDEFLKKNITFGSSNVVILRYLIGFVMLSIGIVLLYIGLKFDNVLFK